ncbi:MAG: hypothetical protein R6U26_02615 [Candidatus Undinarchaeales archaeon]
MKQHIWKIFEFSGWFILLVGIIFGLLYGSMSMGVQMHGALFLIVLGIIFVLIGEYLLGEYSETKYSMIWNALSIGGAFALTVGIIWLVIQFLETYRSWFGILVLLAVGIGLIIFGESVKFEKK